MNVTADDFKKSIDYYLILSRTEDVVVMENGKPVARLISEQQARENILDELTGIIPYEETEVQPREEHGKK